ncbi:hypothetical protein B0H65DRAFT_54867 [Neurospora tetraspora]|uniref:Uncharacterized protein n=1 Tax=Neurospora tetraspora TaxID=94610 RepID=A0AAE0JQ08_9PEZI|nr:hypothetical protein B0H65DRAFT_54867 [Neurospora tetraspora]
MKKVLLKVQRADWGQTLGVFVEHDVDEPDYTLKHETPPQVWFHATSLVQNAILPRNLSERRISPHISKPSAQAESQEARDFKRPGPTYDDGWKTTSFRFVIGGKM